MPRFAGDQSEGELTESDAAVAYDQSGGGDFFRYAEA